MKRLILLVPGAALLALLLGHAGVIPAASLVAPVLFASAMILALLLLVAESDRRP